MTRLLCALVGHDPEPVATDWSADRAWWDCRRHCGWQLRTSLSDPGAWPPATHAAAVALLLVPLAMAGIVLLMMAAGIAAPAPS